tara:strand:- start:73 stop:294 length:222 start_codon:yes stop_codon:yes gene_type:complete
MHPLIDDLNQLSVDKINDQVQQLTKKYYSTTNSNLREQIILVIDTLKLELESRQRDIKINNEQKDLDNLINIS